MIHTVCEIRYDNSLKLVIVTENHDWGDGEWVRQKFSAAMNSHNYNTVLVMIIIISKKTYSSPFIAWVASCKNKQNGGGGGDDEGLGG